MTIGQWAVEAGLPAPTIRYRERLGVLPKPSRVSGQRRYSPDAVLQLARAFSFRLDQMRRLLQGSVPGATPRGRWQQLAIMAAPR